MRRFMIKIWHGRELARMNNEVAELRLILTQQQQQEEGRQHTSSSHQVCTYTWMHLGLKSFSENKVHAGNLWVHGTCTYTSACIIDKHIHAYTSQAASTQGRPCVTAKSTGSSNTAVTTDNAAAKRTFGGITQAEGTNDSTAAKDQASIPVHNYNTTLLRNGEFNSSPTLNKASSALPTRLVRRGKDGMLDAKVLYAIYQVWGMP